MNERKFLVGLVIMLIGGIIMTVSVKLLGLIVILLGAVVGVGGLMDGKSYEDFVKTLENQEKNLVESKTK